MINRLSRSVLMLGCAAIAMPALAEENEQALAETSEQGMAEDGPLMEWQGQEIVVTGDILYSSELNSVKTPTPVIDIPQSLSITSADQIIQQGFDSVG